jgi:fructose-bisphosphate aldolase, class I
MSSQNLETIAKALLADSKGILAADETIGTLTKRFEQLTIQSTPESRRNYRELLFATPHADNFISGVIMYDETIRQQGTNGTRLIDITKDRGVIPGIKVDTGAKPLACCPDEAVTEGLEGLRERLKDYHSLGAQFAKWRAVIRIADQLPSQTCIRANAHALGRYAALCQEQDIVPIIEPEVLMDGAHTLDRCERVTGEVLNAVFNELYQQGVALEGMLLKPNMILPGSSCSKQASVTDVADATLGCLLRHVPAAVPGIVFLSGGQSDVLATTHLNAINSSPSNKPWEISFSYGRALQDMALATWRSDKKNYQAAQQAYYHRAKCNAAASAGKYTEALENEFRSEVAEQHRSEWEDD